MFTLPTSLQFLSVNTIKILNQMSTSPERPTATQQLEIQRYPLEALPYSSQNIASNRARESSKPASYVDKLHLLLFRTFVHTLNSLSKEPSCIGLVPHDVLVRVMLFNPSNFVKTFEQQLRFVLDTSLGFEPEVRCTVLLKLVHIYESRNRDRIKDRKSKESSIEQQQQEL